MGNRILTRASVLGIKKEVSTGIWVPPSGTTDFLALQPDFNIVPATEELTNDEIKNSLGNSKSIQGLESPTASGSHYFRASGVEGTPPDYSAILESAFGSQVDVSTERNTVAASTVSVINVDAGEGVEFPRGRPILVKDATNGYSVRFAHSVSTDAVTLNFDLDNAPASGIDLGLPNYWVPVSTGHPSLSLSHYLGNGGGVMALAGGKVTSYSITAESGQLVNMSYSIDGTWFGYNPVIVTSSNDHIDFDIGAAELNATVPQGIYKTPKELADAIATAMNALSSDEITVTYNNSGANVGKFTIATDGSELNLLWNSGTNTANTIGTLLGFLVAADDTGALTYSGDNAATRAAPYTPAYDANTDPLAAKAGTIRLGNSSDNICFEADTINWTMNTPVAAVNSICSSTGRAETITNSREVTVAITASLRQYDTNVFQRYIENTDTRFMMVLGNKSGGNWVPGTVVAGYIPTATITEASVEDNDGVVFVNFTIKAYVDSNGSGEVYLGTL
jgi:hypothetical protein